MIPSPLESYNRANVNENGVSGETFERIREFNGRNIKIRVFVSSDIKLNEEQLINFVSQTDRKMVYAWKLMNEDNRYTNMVLNNEGTAFNCFDSDNKSVSVRIHDYVTEFRSHSMDERIAKRLRKLAEVSGVEVAASPDGERVSAARPSRPDDRTHSSVGEAPLLAAAAAAEEETSNSASASLSASASAALPPSSEGSDVARPNVEEIE